MKCAVCTGKLKMVDRVYTAVNQGCNIVILDVPVQECTACGVQDYAAKTLINLKKLVALYKLNPNLLGRDPTYVLRYGSLYDQPLHPMSVTLTPYQRVKP